MNTRHRNQMSLPLVSTTVTLVRFLLDKSMQARKITQWCFIDPILREARSLFVNVTDMLDGLDTGKKAQRNLYNIQKQTVLVSFLERDNRPGGAKEKKKKHFGFDFAACAYIDETCDGLLAQISAYGQRHQPQDKGHDGRIVED